MHRSWIGVEVILEFLRKLVDGESLYHMDGV